MGAAALVGEIASCGAHDSYGDGPPCTVGIFCLPYAVVGGAVIGAIIGHVIPAGQEAEGMAAW